MATTQAMRGGCRTFEFEHDGRTVSSSARFVLDCSGRAGVIARQGFRRYESRSPHAGADRHLGTRGRRGSRRARLGPSTTTHTVVETYEDGWAWSVPVSAWVTRHVGAMVNGATTKLTRGPEIAEVYKSELVKTRRSSPRGCRPPAHVCGTCGPAMHPCTRRTSTPTPRGNGCSSATPAPSSIRCRRSA